MFKTKYKKYSHYKKYTLKNIKLKIHFVDYKNLISNYLHLIKLQEYFTLIFTFWKFIFVYIPVQTYFQN